MGAIQIDHEPKRIVAIDLHGHVIMTNTLELRITADGGVAVETQIK